MVDVETGSLRGYVVAMMSDVVSIDGAEIFRVQKAFGLSHRAMADRLGLGLRNYQRLLKGQKKPSKNVLDKVYSMQAQVSSK